ncbi:MAG: hypothetical protein ACOC8K_00690 [Gemmatimonadota bacterium]
MTRVEPDPPRDVTALLVFGTRVEPDFLEELSLHFELFLEAVDRGLDPDGDPDYDWRLADPSFRGRRVLVEPVPAEEAPARRRPVRTILDEARQGIALLTGSTRRPPTFSDTALDHLEAIVAHLEGPELTRMAFYANRESELMTERTLANLRAIRTR